MERKIPGRVFMKAGLSAVLVALTPLTLQQIMAATVTLPVQAHIIDAIEITLQSPLDFGSLALPLAGDPFAVPATVDGLNSITPAAGQPKAGNIRLRGAGKPVTLSVEEPTIRLSNGTTQVSLHDFGFQSGPEGSRVTVTPASAEEAVMVPVGASLARRPGHMSGTYVGAVRVHANFL